ncbi:hypothetical protein ACEF17_10595 [Streptococcus hyovaginalis]
MSWKLTEEEKEKQRKQKIAITEKSLKEGIFILPMDWQNALNFNNGYFIYLQKFCKKYPKHKAGRQIFECPVMRTLYGIGDKDEF